MECVDLASRVSKVEYTLSLRELGHVKFEDDVRGSIEELKETLHEMELKREKQMSFIGGISAVISVIAGVAAFIINKYF